MSPLLTPFSPLSADITCECPLTLCIWLSPSSLSLAPKGFVTAALSCARYNNALRIKATSRVSRSTSWRRREKGTATNQFQTLRTLQTYFRLILDFWANHPSTTLLPRQQFSPLFPPANWWAQKLCRFLFAAGKLPPLKALKYDHLYLGAHRGFPTPQSRAILSQLWDKRY